MIIVIFIMSLVIKFRSLIQRNIWLLNNAFNGEKTMWMEKSFFKHWSEYEIKCCGAKRIERHISFLNNDQMRMNREFKELLLFYHLLYEFDRRWLMEIINDSNFLTQTKEPWKWMLIWTLQQIYNW